MMNYKINSKADLTFRTGSNVVSKFLTISHIQQAIQGFNQTMLSIQENIPVDIFGILGMRNLSAFVGEVFAQNLASVSNNILRSNPHQDGYPDLLLLDKFGLELFKRIEERQGLQDKAPFSPFLNGGIEVKATCGSVPTPALCKKKGLQKPNLGDQRIYLLTGYDWKAHHQETNNLLGLLWDFIDSTPVIVAIFFGNNLTTSDWGKIIHPKENGGRTTSVSIMPSHGVFKMYSNWIMVIDDKHYIDFLNKYNKSNLI